MKKMMLQCLILFSVFYLPASAQTSQFGPFVFLLPAGFNTVNDGSKLLVNNPQKQLCAVLFNSYPLLGNNEETYYQLWKTELKSPNYIAGEISNLSSYQENGYQCITGYFEGETNGVQVHKSAYLYQSGSSCAAILSFTSDVETQYAIQSFFKSLKIQPPVIYQPPTPLEQSYNWYRTLRGPDVTNTSIQVYQSQTALNFTGFSAASQLHLQTLGDSLFHLRVLPALQMLYIGQTRLNDAAAINIGALPAIKHVQSMDQGFPIPLTNAGLQGMSNAATLEVIDLRSVDIPGVNDAGMNHIAKLSRLTKLIISRAPAVTINGIEKLVTLKQLRELNLSFCTLGDSDIPRLTAVIQQLPALQLLFIQSTNITEAGVAPLRQAFPGITIYR